MTQAHIGKIEIMEACSKELDVRGWLCMKVPAYVDVSHENGVRSSQTVRVF